MDEYRKVMALQFLIQKLANDETPSTIRSADIENDGRKRSRVMRELEARGWVTPGKHRATDSWVVNESVLQDTLDSFEFTDNTRYFEKYGVRYGALWAALNVAQRTYIYRNQDRFWFRSISTTAPESKHSSEPFRFGEGSNNGMYDYASTLVVYDVDWAIAESNRQTDARLEQTLAENLQWALQEVGLVNEEEAKLCGTSFYVGDFFALAADRTQKPPDELWPASLTKATETLANRIAEDTRRLELFQRLQLDIAKRGGWSELFKLWRKAIVHSLDTAVDDDEEGEADDTVTAPS